MASRIYDSKLRADSGFRPGWRLNLSETVEVREGAAFYSEGSGAKHVFSQRARNRYSPSQESPALTDATLTIIGAGATLRRDDGSVRLFRRAGSNANSFVMVRKIGRDGASQEFVYDESRLTEVALAGISVLTVEWSGERIVSISDRYGREVAYTYDPSGRLSSVRDVGKQPWSYEYDSMDRLVAGAHPDGQKYLEVSYDQSGKVAQSMSARDFAYHYYGDVTNVVEPAGSHHEFKIDASGVTVGYRNSRGVRWELVLDQINRPKELAKYGDVYRFRYSGSRLTSIDHSGGSQQLNYDDEGRFTHASGVAVDGYLPKQVTYSARGDTVVSDGTRTLRYVYDDSSRLMTIEEDEDAHHLDYDERGFVTGLSVGDSTVVFTRSRLGRITGVQYPDGSSSRYRYDDLGNRERTDFSNGSSMVIMHDGRGNIVNVVDATPDSVELSQSYEIDRHNRVTQVEFAGLTELEVTYDGLSRPTGFAVDDKVVNVEYLSHGEPVRLWSEDGTFMLEESHARSAFLPFSPSSRMFLHNDHRERGQPEYGTVAFSQYTLDIGIVPVEFNEVEGYLEAETALATMKSWLSDQHRSKVEKPSNPVFQPPEYESTNCCLNCPWESPCGQYCTNVIGTGDAICLCSRFTYEPPSGGSQQCSVNYQSSGDAEHLMQANASVPAKADTTIREWLLSLDFTFRIDYERGATVVCSNMERIDQTFQSLPYDMKLSFPASSSVVISGHTHPQFDKRHVGKVITIYEAEDKYGKPLPEKHTITSPEELNRINTANQKCSIIDKQTAKDHYPVLLRVPPARAIKECRY